MEAYKGSQVLVIDSDLNTCQTLKGMMQKWGLSPRIVTEVPAAVDLVRRNGSDVVMLSSHVLHEPVFDSVAGLCDDSSEKKLILIRDSSDRDHALDALRQCAFDILEKPVRQENVYHVLRHALQILQQEREIERLSEELSRSKAELKIRESQLEAQQSLIQEMDNQMIETNRAFSVLAQNIDRERAQMEKQVTSRIRSLAFPYIEKLRSTRALKPYLSDLDALMALLDDLTNDFTLDSRISSLLSPAEIKIASLIKAGLSTEEIAARLNVSPTTVRTHRKNIRKKLNINQHQYSLKNFLSSC